MSTLSDRQETLVHSAREAARYWTLYGDPATHGVIERAWLTMADRIEAGEAEYDTPFLIAAYEESERLRRDDPAWGDRLRARQEAGEFSREDGIQKDKG